MNFLFVIMYMQEQYAVIGAIFVLIFVLWKGMLEHTLLPLQSSFTPQETNNYGDEGGDEVIQHEKIRPYTWKWEKGTMDTIDELDLIAKKEHSGVNHRCDVRHDVPAMFLCMRCVA